MKWLRDPLQDRVGEKRVIRKFLLFPTCIRNEYRWLEWAYIEQYVVKFVGGMYEMGGKNYWMNDYWVTEKSYNCSC